MSINREFFFQQCRWTLFAGRYTQAQVHGLNHLLDHWETHYASEDDRWLAYILATSHHETDKKHQPIEEYGRGRGRPYGRPSGPHGHVYYGRGYCQLTWEINYRRFERLLGLPLVEQPDLACEPETAAVILFRGMIEGLFTGRKLGHYISGKKCDWVNARRVVNGLDKANLIADHARRFYAAISYTRD